MNQHITFTSVDITNDTKLLESPTVNIRIPKECRVDIQEIYWILGTKGGKTGMVALASELIDPWYADMKDRLPRCSWRRLGHDYWEDKPLSEPNLKYAAIDGYVSHELYRQIVKSRSRHRIIEPPPRQVVCPRCRSVDESTNRGKRPKASWDRLPSPTGWDVDY